MITPLKKTTLHDLLNKPILFDANIFMVGISERVSDQNCSFENMKHLYIKPLFESFTDIYIHEEVYKELDEDARTFVDIMSINSCYFLINYIQSLRTLRKNNF